MKIMFCHDGTERAQRTLEKTVDYFKLIKPDILLLSVVEDILDTSEVYNGLTGEYEKEHNNIIHQSAEWVAGNGLEVHVMLANGDPRRMIMEAIKKNSPDIVVIARKEKSTLMSVFSKSVSAYLIKNAGCHLMVMGPA